MLQLIILIGLAIVAAFFATQNTQNVSLTLATYQIQMIPLYILVLASLLIGMILSWLMSLGGIFSSLITIYKGENRIKASDKEVLELQKKIDRLESDNEKLKQKLHPND